MTKLKKHVAVLMGGESAEREISLLSGERVVNALNELGHQVTKVDPDYNLANNLLKIKPDVVFNALHGTFGEDGAIAGLLEVLKIPYTHSGVMASSIALNKKMTKDIVSSRGVKVPNGKIISLQEVIEASEKGKDIFPRPYVIKPIQQGSSIGVYIINEGDNLHFDYKTWKYGEEIIVEEYISGKELSVAYFNGKAIGVLELRPKLKFLDYTAKYTDGVTDHIIPAEIHEDVYKKALKYAEVAHETLSCRTISRSDFRFDESKGVEGLYFLEINTHPGLTRLSMVPDIAKYKGIELKDLVDQLIIDAKCDITP
jgi:D-alanine-D-alanine ligase